MKIVTIELSDDEAEILEKWGNIVGRSLSAFIQDEVVPDYITGNEGSLAENLVCRIYDTLEEAKTSTGKMDALIGVDDWRYYRKQDGRVHVGIGKDWGNAHAGEELIEA